MTQPAVVEGVAIFLAKNQCAGMDASLAQSPSKWDIHEFMLDLMVTFHWQPEVFVVALVYLSRFAERSGVAVELCHWQKLTVVATILASKVWDEEPFDNAELAQISPLHFLDELDTLERAFVQGLEHDVVVREPDYMRTHFLLRTCAVADSTEFRLPRLHAERSARLAVCSLRMQAELCDPCQKK